MPPRINRSLTSSARATLTSMPDEILWEICLRVDNLGGLAQVCRRLHLFSKSNTLRAQYLVKTYGRPYAMFHAIARPKIFDPLLCKALIAAGATISLALVQELTKVISVSRAFRSRARGQTHICLSRHSHYIQRYFSSGNARIEYAKKDSWCLNLTFLAATAVIIEGAIRYSHLRLETSEMELFLDWTTGRIALSRAALETMFLERQFAPLPLRMEQYKASYTKNLLSNVLENAATVSELLYAQLIHNSRKRKTPVVSSGPAKIKMTKT
ncbi:hypothetical protein BCV69DRAFT_311370 [Microstroma glucosiphilum]|uniref:F-box domain-containing protein n=1 Tax=Pseudomicrostroma glucosiphilum TaxID=1684307 RepID=A0A316UBK7_9BASI|nr:hypothetical protein BCV69DRAFT_311370 [Pseudomicrostroma glucosiphilum]PWN22576.1 hypothetical protein BCV69DRAFT_311370 [Pseudomicrostroma glucosiphilum]